VLGQFLERDRAAVGDRVVGRNHDLELLPAQAADGPPPVQGWRPDAEVAETLAHGVLRELAMRELVQPDEGAGKALPPRLDHVGQQPQRDRPDGADLELAGLELQRLARGADGSLGRADRRERVGKERLAGAREAHRPRQPLEQLPAELLLQGPNLLR
jgi:hypothetical protein